MSDKADAQGSSSHAVLFFIAGTLAGAAAAVLFLPDVRKKARSIAQEAVNEIRDGELRADVVQTEHQTKKALKAGWEAFVNTLTENPADRSAPPSEQ